MATVRPLRRSIPARAGIGLRPEHYDAVLAEPPDVAWLEVHSENYFGAGGRPMDVLAAVAQRYPLSFHGIGLSLGSTDPLDHRHVDQLKHLADRFRPAFVSDHLAWRSVDGTHFNDLLPLPYTLEALGLVEQRVAAVQGLLGRRLLVENPSSYLGFQASVIPEAEFLNELAERTGCGLLLDVNNVYVSACNQGWDPVDYLDSIVGDRVVEIHLAGHTVREIDGARLLIDSHNAPVADEVWALYERVITHIGPRPTLIEWDTDLPPLETLLTEARRADQVLEECRRGQPA